MKVSGSPWGHYSRVGMTHGIPITAAQLEKVYLPTWRAHKAALPHYGLQTGLTPKKWWKDFISKVFISAGFHGSQEKLDDVKDDIWQQFSDGSCWEVLPDSHATLAELKRRDVKLGVVSNLDERLQLNLIALNLIKYFDFIVTTAETKTSKPDPAMFQAAVDLSGVVAMETGHVGDDVHEDYWAAKDFGFSAFIVDRERKLSEDKLINVDKTHILTNLGQLLNFVWILIVVCL